MPALVGALWGWRMESSSPRFLTNCVIFSRSSCPLPFLHLSPDFFPDRGEIPRQSEWTYSLCSDERLPDQEMHVLPAQAKVLGGSVVIALIRRLPTVF